jgi:hypothetical protein
MNKPKYKTMYMHTLDGKPATFIIDGVYFGKNGQSITLAKNLRQIRREQRIDQINFPRLIFQHGHRLVKVPT